MAVGLTRREKDKFRKRNERKSADVAIPPCADPVRRAFALESVRNFCMTYGVHGEGVEPTFTHEPTKIQLDIMEGLLELIKVAGKKAWAAPRGEGKTTAAEWTVMYGICKGILGFVFIVAATGEHAERILSDIKEQFERNELLAADFPEICAPIRDLEGSTQRQRTQTVDGERTLLHWSGNFVQFPQVKGSPASRALIATKGLDAHIRGIKVGSRRPQLIIVEDPETEESAKSQDQIKKRRLEIDRALGGSGGHSRGVSIGLLGTIQNRICLTYEYTDPVQRPNWFGVRFKWLAKMPDKMELWEEYMHLRAVDKQNGDKFCRSSHQFYLDHKAEMDAGAEVANIYRFDATILPDGSQKEVSSLQAFFNFVADENWDFVNTEFQNDPPDDGPQVSGLTAELIGGCASGLKHRHLPPECAKLTIGLDLNPASWCHWVAVAWTPFCVGTVVDYGRFDIPGLGRSPSRATLEKSLIARLGEWRTDVLSTEYFLASGGTKRVDLVAIDSGSGLHTNAVYEFVKSAGGLPFVACKGFAPWHQKRATEDCRPGDNLAIVRQQGHRIWLYEFDANHWKLFVHQRFLTPTLDANNCLNAGSMSLFNLPDAEQFKKDRREFCHQIVGEIWTITPADGAKREKQGFVMRPGGKNHWLDAMAQACMGASCCGVRLMSQAREPLARSRPTVIPQSRLISRPGGWIPQRGHS